jgi:phosphatidylserine decarboxylase
MDADGVTAAGSSLAVAAAVAARAPTRRWALVPALAGVALGAFFRDPDRAVPADPAAVVAASDGRVLAVEEREERRFDAGCTRWLRIAVFLALTDVHVNRSPVAGQVVALHRESGGAAAAMTSAAEHNNSVHVVLRTARGPVVVSQRVGMVARRIVTRVRHGTVLGIGERFGLIRFGSRTDVYLPAGAALPAVVPGHRVSGGSTVIAHWR